MNPKDNIFPLCVGGIAIAILSIAFVSPFQAPTGVSAQRGDSGATTTTGGMAGMSHMIDGGSRSRNATMSTNITSGALAGGNESTSEVRMHINEALSAAHSGDMQAVIMHLNLALNALGGLSTSAQGNMTGAAGGDPVSDATMTSHQNNISFK